MHLEVVTLYVSGTKLGQTKTANMHYLKPWIFSLNLQKLPGSFNLNASEIFF